MTNLKFKVQGQIIQKMDDNDVVEKSRNEYNAVFEFSDDWIDIENKQAYFTRYKDGFCVKADIDENGICKVPWEVTELPMFYVSVAGGDLKTVTRASVFVEQTGYSEDAEKSGTVPEVIRTPQSISLQDGMLLLLDKNGEAVGEGVKMQQTVVDDKLSDTSENPVENKVVANEVFAVKGLLNVSPVAVSGTAVRVDDVYAAPHDVAVTLSGGGITDYSSVKVRRTGKNLIPFPYPSLGGAGSAVTKNGVTVTVQEDGGVRLKGTATVTTYFNLTNSIRYSKSNLNNIQNEYATDNFVAISGGNMYYTYANTTLAIIAEADKTYDATIYPQVEIGNRPTEFECGIPLEYFTPNADGTVEGVKSISPTMSLTTDTDGVTVSLTYQKVKQFKRIHTIVNCPAFTNQPIVDGDLHTDFKPWNETYYFVHILDSTVGTFQLMALKDDTSTVIDQTFTLADLNTGNSGTLKENSPVDFISVGTGWQIRSAGVEKISFYGMNAAEMSIKASGFANVSGYLFISSINGFMGNDFKYSGSVSSTIYNGDAGFLFSASAVKSKNVLISLNATFKVGQKMMNVNGNCSYQATDDTDFFVYKGNKTTLPIAGICARKDLTDFEKNKIKEFDFKIASGFIFRNGFEIEVKGRE